MAAVALATEPLGWLLTVPGALFAGWLGLMTMALPNMLWINGMKVLPPGTVATLLVAEPLTATVLGVVRLHESLSVSSVVGLVAVVAGLALLTISEGRAPSPVG